MPPPLSSLLYADHRVFDHRLRCRFSSTVLPLMHFDATLSVFHFNLPLFIASQLNAEPQQWAPRLSFHALQHIRVSRPFFSLLTRRLEEIAFSSRSSVFGVWLPSWRFTSDSSLETSFKFPTLLGFSLQSFVPLPWSKKSLFFFFPFSRFPSKPFRL